MNKTTADQILYWYKLLLEYGEAKKNRTITRKHFCTEKKIDEKKLSNMQYRINYLKFTNNATYEKNVSLAKKQMSSGMTASKFARLNDISVSDLSETKTHLRYLSVIEEFEKTNENPVMNFVQVKPKEIALIEPIEECTPSELIVKQNDIEILIAQGVKVSISPNIDSSKIIKIIQLLKDL